MEISRIHTSNYQSLSHKHWVSILQVPPAISVRAQCRVKICINLHAFLYCVLNMWTSTFCCVYANLGFVIYLRCAFDWDTIWKCTGDSRVCQYWDSKPCMHVVLLCCGLSVHLSVCLLVCSFQQTRHLERPEDHGLRVPLYILHHAARSGQTGKTLFLLSPAVRICALAMFMFF